MILIGNGTGISPMRSFVNEKLYEVFNDGKTKFGKMILFYGCRNDGDFIFHSDYETATKAKSLDELYVAFSRKDVSLFLEIKKLA